jgi:hypothetical protein
MGGGGRYSLLLALALSLLLSNCRKIEPEPQDPTASALQIGQAQQWLQGQSLQFPTEKLINPNSAQRRGEALPDSLPFVPIWQEAKQQPLPNGNTMLYLPLHRAVMVYYYKPFLRRLRIELNPQGEVVQAHIVEFVAQSLEQILQNEAQWLAKAFASQIEGLEGYALVYDLHHQLLQGHRFQAGVRKNAARWFQHYPENNSTQQRCDDPPCESQAQIYDPSTEMGVEEEGAQDVPPPPSPSGGGSHSSHHDIYIQSIVPYPSGIGTGVGYADPSFGIGGGAYSPYDPGISKGGGIAYESPINPPEYLHPKFKQLATEYSNLSDKQWRRLNAVFETLDKEPTFNKMLDYMSSKNYKVSFTASSRLPNQTGMAFGGNGSSGGILLNSRKSEALINMDFLFEELFHAFQDCYYHQTGNVHYKAHKDSGGALGKSNIELEAKITYEVLYQVNHSQRTKDKKNPYSPARLSNDLKPKDDFIDFIKKISNKGTKLPNNQDIQWQDYKKMLDLFLDVYKDTSYNHPYISGFLPEAMFFLFGQ